MLTELQQAIEVTERTNITVIFTNIRTSKSTYYLLYDISHSKTHTAIIPFSILLQILPSPAKKNTKNWRFQFKNRRKEEQAQKIGKNRNWTPCMWPPLSCNTVSELKKHSTVFKSSFKSIQSKITLTIISSSSNLNLGLSQELFLSTNLHNVICMYILLFPRAGGTLGIFGWVHVCAAGTLEPLAYTSSSECFLPYTRLQ